MTIKERRKLIDDDCLLSLTKQAELLDISRGSIYYEPVIKEEDILIMNAIDKIYTKRPFYGSRRIRFDLRDYHSIYIGRKRTQRLMRTMGVEAIYPKQKNLSRADKEHYKYPYLLRNLAINRPNQVWGTDITYVRLENSWCYLVAFIDWHSRYVLSWQLSSTLESDFCIQALKQALKINVPEIANSDQGVQYTSKDYVDVLKKAEINISMDGRGRCMDNIFTERLWRTVKYENVYIHSYQTIEEARAGLKKYFNFYNNERRHQSLNDQRPTEVYFGKSVDLGQVAKKQGRRIVSKALTADEMIPNTCSSNQIFQISINS